MWVWWFCGCYVFVWFLGFVLGLAGFFASAGVWEKPFPHKNTWISLFVVVGACRVSPSHHIQSRPNHNKKQFKKNPVFDLLIKHLHGILQVLWWLSVLERYP